MGMGMKSLKWEGIGTKNLLPHTSTTATTACGSYETAKDTNFSCKNRPTSALEVFLNDMRYINPRFTYLLTYLPHTHYIYNFISPSYVTLCENMVFS